MFHQSCHLTETVPIVRLAVLSSSIIQASSKSIRSSVPFINGLWQKSQVLIAITLQRGSIHRHRSQKIKNELIFTVFLPSS